MISDKSMQVCLIGDTKGPHDEGMRNTNLHLIEELKRDVGLLVINPGEYFSVSVLKKIKKFHPDIIHYLQGPTIRSLILCRALRFIFPKAKTVLLAQNPSLRKHWDSVLPYLAPHHVFSITKDFHWRLIHLGISSQIIFPGVDQNKFQPVGKETKIEIRKSLGIPIEKKVVLHVGHFTEARGVLTLGRLQSEFEPEIQFVIVGSSTNRPQSLIVEQLRNQGVKIITDFIPQIEKIYQASDAYIFPGDRTDSAIDIPLSVLEAMAVNLPVITTRFRGLPDMFEEKPWFKYVDSMDSMREAVKAVVFNKDMKPETRAMVGPYTWNKFAKTIIETYKNINKGFSS